MAATEELIGELPPAWRKAGYAAITAVSVTVGYFLFVSGPISDAKAAAVAAENHTDRVDAEIGSVQSDVSAIRQHEAQSDQKLSDMKDSVDAINSKLDRLLIRGQKPGQFP